MNLLKKVARIYLAVLIMLTVIVVAQMKSDSFGNLKCLAMDGFSEKNGIRGFVLSPEQEQPATVNAIEVKEQLKVDIMQIVYICLIAAGVVAVGIILVNWFKSARRGN